jgi:hypothetical protein
MRPSPPINDRNSGRLLADSAHARISVRDSPPIARPILSRHAQIARSHRRTRPCLAENRSPQPLRSSLLEPELAAKSHSARCSAAPYLPRFRALALFRRRPQVRVDSFVIPASETLHKTGSRHHSIIAAKSSARSSIHRRPKVRSTQRPLSGHSKNVVKCRKPPSVRCIPRDDVACHSSPTIEANSLTGIRGMLMAYSMEFVSA